MDEKAAEPACDLLAADATARYPTCLAAYSCWTDRMFAGLMLVQWLACIAIAIWFAPRTSLGLESPAQPQFWSAIYFGAAFALLPVLFAATFPGRAFTRHVMAVSQMLFGSLLVYVSGGRMETHFLLFSSLAFLALYRDWRVLITASVVAISAHFLRGSGWPLFINGLASALSWQWLEHSSWIALTDVFLISMIRRSDRVLKEMTRREAERDAWQSTTEVKVEQRTHEVAETQAIAEAALCESEALRLSLDEHSIVSITDAQGRITHANDAFCRISGYAREELVGSDHRILNSGMHSKEFWKTVWNAIACGTAWRGEICNRSKHGELYWVDSIIVPLKNSTGTPEKYISIRTDITERKRVEMQLHATNVELMISREKAESASRAKSEFLANMSHEIRTPLTAILGFCEILREEDDGLLGPIYRRQLHDTIRRAGEHLLNVINDVLDLSKIEAGQFQLESITTLLPNLLVEVDSLMRERVANKDVVLTTRLQSALPDRIISDPTRLRQILMNLVGNAAKFTERGSIEVRARVDDSSTSRKLVISVKDTGRGLTPEQAEQLFLPFVQADNSVTRKYGGTGLGLSISLHLARMLGGEVRLSFSKPDVGSQFVLELPLVVAPGAILVDDLNICPTSKAATGRNAAQKLFGRLLLAEDGEDNQQLILFHLTKAGAEVEIAQNGAIALQMLNAATLAGRPFDVLLTDMQMPEMDGYSLARALRAEGNAIPIIALTAHARPDDRQKCLDAGCNDFVSKPIHKQTLLASCLRWLEHSRSSASPTAQDTCGSGAELASSESAIEPLISDFAADEVLGPLVDKFLRNLSHRVESIRQAVTHRQWTTLKVLTHQLKGSGGGYGFPMLSDLAQTVEELAKDEADWSLIEPEVTSLLRACEQAIAGRSLSLTNKSQFLVKEHSL